MRQWEDKKAHFEVIVGKSMAEDGPSRCFGFVQSYDEKPKRRFFELLKGQGMQMNQRVMFFSDGTTDIREVQLYLNPEAEHYLDWFQLTMRLTVMGQHAKGLDATQQKRKATLKSPEALNIICGMGMWFERETRSKTCTAFWTTKALPARTVRS